MNKRVMWNNTEVGSILAYGKYAIVNIDQMMMGTKFNGLRKDMKSKIADWFNCEKSDIHFVK